MIMLYLAINQNLMAKASTLPTLSAASQEVLNNSHKFLPLLQLRRVAALGKPDPFDLLDLTEIWHHDFVLCFVVATIDEEGRNVDML